MILLLPVVTLLLWRRCKHKKSINPDAVGINSGLLVEVTTHQVREEDALPDNSGSVADNVWQHEPTHEVSAANTTLEQVMTEAAGYC